ncbi:helix-turn-helix transcriptional regulator [Amycolatopsis sp. WAC 01376]|uniref:helix-turn-helix transcriptional regulator n=1 Tax=unclassified Amycolatopsis TaxID=2618356 RepID=UPI0013154B53|nr:LuxR C-terminal-related transcriptional regulator [Amycolatopsis sp. WAC 01376]
MTHTVPVAEDAGMFSIALLSGNEVLRHGLEIVLRSVPGVGTVHRCGSREDIDGLAALPVLDFVIVASADARWLDSVAGAFAAKTKILVVIDEMSVTGPVLPTSVPVDGFLSQQDLSAETLGDGLRRCALGELPMPSRLARELLFRADDPTSRQRMRAVKLTSRETEALSLLVKGLSNKQIARRLTISSHGAKRLVGSIMLKLDSPNRTTAAVNAIKAGLLDDH